MSKKGKKSKKSKKVKTEDVLADLLKTAEEDADLVADYLMKFTIERQWQEMQAEELTPRQWQETQVEEPTPVITENTMGKKGKTQRQVRVRQTPRRRKAKAWRSGHNEGSWIPGKFVEPRR